MRIVLALLPGTDFGRVLLFCGLMVPGAVIFAATFAAAESLTFFLGNAQAVSSALAEFMLSFSLYPEGVFGKNLRWLFYSIIPSGFVAFVPLRIYRALDWALVPALWAIAALYAALAPRWVRAATSTRWARCSTRWSPAARPSAPTIRAPCCAR